MAMGNSRMTIPYPFNTVALRIGGEVTLRAFPIGLALFVMPPFAVASSPEQQGLAFIAVIIWTTTTGHSHAATGLAPCWRGGSGSNWTQTLLLFFGSSEGA